MLSTQIRPAQPGLFTAQALGVDDFELSQITAEFSAISSGELEHHLFDAPSSLSDLTPQERIERDQGAF